MKRGTQQYGSCIRPQQGTVLVIALIMLLLLTIIGISAMRGTLLQERMAGNTRDLHVAMHAAERALREAERAILLGVMSVGECSAAEFATREDVKDLFSESSGDGVEWGWRYCGPEVREIFTGSERVPPGPVREVELYTVIGVGGAPGGGQKVISSVFAQPRL